ncbi:MAG: AAA family ATPase [Planctomycetes bacterium]|nr:AAA family ATPase [Planctomycetota bacterium]
MSDTLSLLIRAGNPLIAIETSDETRAMQLVQDVASELRKPLWEWSLTIGLRPVSRRGTDPPVVKEGKSLPALKHIVENTHEAIYVMKDLGPHCKDALVHRTMRDLLQVLGESRATMILIDALPLADEIRRFAVYYEIGWPDAAELESAARETFRRIRRESGTKVKATISKRQMEQLVQSLRGLTCQEAERVVASAIYDDYLLDASDLPRIVEGKRTLLGSAGCLEAISADVRPEDIGGLNNLKSWLKQRRGGFSKQAREFGLESPRGVLMLGVPGSGKSLCAKVVASDWNMPLLRLDPGMLYQKFIGESESQLRQALKQAEAMAPVILWIDEIEKAFASASAGSADGGLSKRMFGTLLSWMQDHRHPIFLIATANDISALPPELMRKGRFDEVFFVDLPSLKSREQILAIHLRRRQRQPKEYDLKGLAAAAVDFTGSELEQAVISALFTAFSRHSELANEHLFEEIGKTRPLAVLMAEKIEELRAWSRNRCVQAN